MRAFHQLLPSALFIEPHYRYGDKSFAAISRETLHLLRCCVTTTRITAAKEEAPDSVAIQSDGAANLLVENEQPIHVAVFNRTYEIGGSGSGDAGSVHT